MHMNMYYNIIEYTLQYYILLYNLYNNNNIFIININNSQEQVTLHVQGQLPVSQHNKLLTNEKELS